MNKLSFHQNFYINHKMTIRLCILVLNKMCIFQATIGIDFLSKTMYLDDRTVSTKSWYFIVDIYEIVMVFN